MSLLSEKDWARLQFCQSVVVYELKRYNIMRVNQHLPGVGEES